MSSRKRSRVVDSSPDDSEPSLLHRIRNMWQFANLCQWIYTFGKAAKIDESLDIEVFHTTLDLSQVSLTLIIVVKIGNRSGMPQT